MNTKGFFSDLKETMNDRLKNPFIFSFVFSWISWNWLLVYQIFTFDSTIKLSNRVQLIADYISIHKYNNLTWCPFFSSFVIAFLYLLGSATFTSLFNFYNTTIKALINKGTLRGDIVPLQYFKYLENKYDDLRKRSNRYITENITLESEVKQLKEDKHNALESNKTLTRSVDENDKRIEFINGQNESLRIELQEQKLFKIKAKNISSEIFISTISYSLLVLDIHGNLTKKLKGQRYIRFLENGTVIDIVSKEQLYNFEDVQLTKDGRMLGFVFTEINNTNNKIQFYLIRNLKGQNDMAGHLILGSNAFPVTLNEKLA